LTTFIRLLQAKDKEVALRQAIGSTNLDIVFQKGVEEFKDIPGEPYIYWLPSEVIAKYRDLSSLQSGDREARHGGATLDDFRFLRIWTEVKLLADRSRWHPMLKGGAIPAFATPIYMAVNWLHDGRELKSYVSAVRDSNGWGPNWTAVLNGYEYYGRQGITWSARPHRRGHFAHVPPGCIFSHTGMMLFLPADQHWAFLAITNSRPFVFLLHSLMSRGTSGGQTLQYDSGYVGSVPVPEFADTIFRELETLAMRGWRLSQKAQSSDETSQFFLYPGADRSSDGIECILSEIDELCYDAYQFSETTRDLIKASFEELDVPDLPGDSDSLSGDDDYAESEAEASTGELSFQYLSWSIGVAFGRFDSRLATGERDAPPEPDPFDPLPCTSPGMLPNGVAPFHDHNGILVDDQGHPHDLPRLIEEVLARVKTDVPGDVRRWLQREFFPIHLTQYTKSRRKAPIYWPLATTSGSYTLWLYYPNLTSQTIYTAVNDFVEPKLQQAIREAATLREKSAARSRDDEKKLEELLSLELELIELRDSLLQIAQTYRPDQDDGVQITAAPLWPLFRHKPWQKILKDTWIKLEKGDYDWAHLAMAYWPDRVREKCRTDKSLAIAHDLEHLYIEPDAKPKSARGRKPAGGDE
jgi:hypothetical protein